MLFFKAAWSDHRKEWKTMLFSEEEWKEIAEKVVKRRHYVRKVDEEAAIIWRDYVKLKPLTDNIPKFISEKFKEHNAKYPVKPISRKTDRVREISRNMIHKSYYVSEKLIRHVRITEVFTDENGKLDNPNGPAKIYPNNRKEWYYHGEFVMANLIPAPDSK